jgi:hypothetical protein
MSMTIYLAPLVLLAGLILYGWAPPANTKMQKLALIAIAVGLLVTLQMFASHALHF